MTAADVLLPRRAVAELVARLRGSALDPAALSMAREIVVAVRDSGEAGLRRFAEEWDGLPAGAPLSLGPGLLRAAYDGLPPEQRSLLERVAGRIREFAVGQRRALRDHAVDIDGLECGHEFAPVLRAGCYAPGGRYPLPSSVLMTAVTARAAGVETVLVASPRPAAITLAAAHVAGADAVLPVGGAQAIALLAYGAAPIPACDVVVGPGNRFVTAAKHLVAADVGIDMLAGPSELVVVAAACADPELVAADLLAQAEHDPDARVVLIDVGSDGEEQGIATAVVAALGRQLGELARDSVSNAEIARTALRCGATVHCADLDAAVSVCDALAPEHLALHAPAAEQLRGRFRQFGALFAGAGCAEVLGDYGAGPNHVLPTGGHARHTGGLSVATFLRLRTWMRGRSDPGLLADAAALARLEGLHAHARAALSRIDTRS